MSRKRPNMTLEEVLDILDEDEPMMADSDEEFDVLEETEIDEANNNDNETNCRYHNILSFLR